MRQEPRPQEIYRHFKGNMYQVVTIARHSETREKMVVYQQLYAPYEVYVRPLEMFMSRIDTRKYPDEKQTYRFEKVDVRGEAPAEKLGKIPERRETEEPAPSKSTEKEKGGGPEIAADASGLDPGLVAFLDADSYEKKLQILSSLHPRITDTMIDTMAVSLDTEVKEGDIEMRYSEIKNCLLTMERFECNRLR